MGCAAAFVLLIGAVLPAGLVGRGMDDYRSTKREAAIRAVAEMGRRHQGDMGNYRVTAWRVTSVEKCRSRCPRPCSVRVGLFTLFGIPSGETGVSRGPSGRAGKAREKS